MTHVHILAICGYTTGGLALMAKKLGYFVTGSDEDAYPPMSTLLTARGVVWVNFHSAQNLERWGRPNLVIQGNQIREGNPELLEAQRQKIKVISDSEFFYELTRNRRRVVVTGTHGKTTTSALIAWILQVAGRKPGFRLGTVVKNFKESVRLGEGKEFVFEGDEYTTTFADQRPKFFHFHPHIAIINNIEWDHPDIFKTQKSYLKIFQTYLVEKLPRDGRLVVNAEDVPAVKISLKARCPVVKFGLKEGNYSTQNISFVRGKTGFDLYFGSRFLGHLETGLPGYHNIKNSLAAVATALSLGVKFGKIKKALWSFKGTSRRFEIVAKVRGITVIDDYAHHPTKVRETLNATRQRFPKSRILAVYVPHTYSRTRALFKEYGKAFVGADLLIIPDIEAARERHLSALVHSRDLVRVIAEHQNNVYYMAEQKKVIDFLDTQARRGDVILCMSVRGFDDLARKLVARLKRKIN